MTTKLHSLQTFIPGMQFDEFEVLHILLVYTQIVFANCTGCAEAREASDFKVVVSHSYHLVERTGSFHCRDVSVGSISFYSTSGYLSECAENDIEIIINQMA